MRAETVPLWFLDYHQNDHLKMSFIWNFKSLRIAD